MALRENFEQKAASEEGFKTPLRFDAKNNPYLKETEHAHAAQLMLLIHNLLGSQGLKSDGSPFDFSILALILGFEQPQDVKNWIETADKNEGEALKSVHSVDFDALHAYSKQEPELLKQPKLSDLGITANPNFEAAMAFTMQEEGGYNPNEPRGAVALHGINSEFHPEFFQDPSYANMVKTYKEYWDAIPGIETMKQDWAVAAFDASFNCGPGRAKAWLTQSNGDLDRFIELREQHFQNLATKNPATYGRYMQGWKNRIQHLEDHIANLPRKEFTQAAAQEPPALKTKSSPLLTAENNANFTATTAKPA